jgi:biotin carboxyl carrier protein
MAIIKVESETAGTIWKLESEVGKRVAKDDVLLIVECMKMEIPVVAPADGTIAEIRVAEGDVIAEQQVLLVLEN